MQISAGTRVVSSFLSLMLLGLTAQAQETVNPANALGSQETSAANADSTPASSGYSKVRIVRLSEVKGEVQMDRNVGRGFETPMANLPITEGSTLLTKNGVAEIEFEDNSTLRVAQNSRVVFTRLEMLPSGAKFSAVRVDAGEVYVSLLKTKGNEFSLSFGKQKVDLPPDSHVRLQLMGDKADLAVLHGDVQVNGTSGAAAEASKNRTMTFNLQGDDQPIVAKSVAEQPLDAWDKDASQYHKSFANVSSFGNTPYSYGLSDMNYYGSFINGCGGSMWRPYFTSAAWDPYSSGAWAYYPSAGYSWVSPYPWAWTPYHYGSWAFCDGIGWGWRPGGVWMGLANNGFASNPGVPGTAGGGTTRPRPPGHPPINQSGSIVPVNLKAIPVSGLSPKADSFVFRGNSAGFGVPRGSLGKLNSFSHESVNHGVASTNIYYGGQRSVSSGAMAGPSAGMSRGSGMTGSISTHAPSSGPSMSGGMSSPSAGGMSRGGGGGGGMSGGGSHH